MKSANLDLPPSEKLKFTFFDKQKAPNSEEKIELKEKKVFNGFIFEGRKELFFIRRGVYSRLIISYILFSYDSIDK